MASMPALDLTTSDFCIGCFELIICKKKFYCLWQCTPNRGVQSANQSVSQASRQAVRQTVGRASKQAQKHTAWVFSVADSVTSNRESEHS